jgi:hypothetical protein
LVPEPPLLLLLLLLLRVAVAVAVAVAVVTVVVVVVVAVVAEPSILIALTAAAPWSLLLSLVVGPGGSRFMGITGSR